MNKITTTAGIVALGAASLHAAVDAPLAGSQQATKPWSISATLRGFYDDNYATAPDRFARDSFGFEVSPSAAVNIIRDQTAFGLNYVYSYRYYQDRAHLGLPSDDQAHQVNAKLSHAFTPRYKLDLSDSFVVAQEPTLIAGDLPVLASFLRSDSSAYRNHAQGSFSAGITEETTVVLGYSNQWYDYDQEGPNSFSALLDRVENLGSINLRQVVLPKTVVVAGYQFERIDYNAPFSVSPITIFNPANPLNPNLISSDERDRYSHYFYIGVDQGITPTLNASLRVGAQYTVYDNLKTIKADDSDWSPYADANITWLYMPGSYAQIGVRHQRNPTDVAFIGLSPNLDAESTSVYGSVNHRFFGGFVASLIAQYQHSTYNAGGNDTSDDYYLVGVNLTYELNRFVALEAGYNFDHLDSDIPSVGNFAFAGDARSFERNRVYIGVRGTY